jgi:indolepyruvate ferredoxin oxidoreductase
MLDAAFPTLARLKGLRGTPLDLFGRTAERRMERGLIRDYEAALDRLLAGLSRERLETAVKIAAVPQQIRGFGHVKEASVKPAKAEEARLWAEWDELAVKEAVPA